MTFYDSMTPEQIEIYDKLNIDKGVIKHKQLKRGIGISSMLVDIAVRKALRPNAKVLLVTDNKLHYYHMRAQIFETTKAICGYFPKHLNFSKYILGPDNLLHVVNPINENCLRGIRYDCIILDLFKPENMNKDREYFFDVLYNSTMIKTETIIKNCIDY